MKTEKQLKQLEEARRHIRNRACSEETKRKISMANDGNFFAVCDYCGKKYHTKKSHYQKRKRHFCSRDCYAKYRREILPKEEQNAYGTGLSQEERDKRKRRVLPSITICATRKFNDSLVKYAVMKTRKPTMMTMISLWKLDGYVGIAIENGIKNTTTLNSWR